MLFVVVGEMFFIPKTLRWEGNEQILRDFDALVASSSRPASITNLSGQTASPPVNGQSSATTPKVVGSMLFDPIKVCWVHQLGDALRTVSQLSTSWRSSMKGKEKDGGPSSELSTWRA